MWNLPVLLMGHDWACKNWFKFLQKTDPSSPTIVCVAFRAVVGAIAIDSGNADEAAKAFWSVHSGTVGRAVSL
ncbi:hypothetical protein REPUB_Repub08aG0086400 [Reevesia pubescens]